MKPTIGRIVHYVSDKLRDGSKGPAPHWPALITRVWNPALVNLTVFPDGSTPFAYSSCSQDESALRAFTWHWPEKEEA